MYQRLSPTLSLVHYSSASSAALRCAFYLYFHFRPFGPPIRLDSTCLGINVRLFNVVHTTGRAYPAPRAAKIARRCSRQRRFSFLSPYADSLDIFLSFQIDARAVRRAAGVHPPPSGSSPLPKHGPQQHLSAHTHKDRLHIPIIYVRITEWDGHVHHMFHFHFHGGVGGAGYISG